LHADVVHSQIVQLLFVEALTGETQLQDRDARGVVLDDERRKGAGRQRADLQLADGRDLRHCLRNVHARMEEDLDDPDAHQRLRLDVVDVIDGYGHAALGIGHDAVGDLIRRQAGEVPHHRHHGDVDVGKDVHRHRFDAVDAEDQDQQRKDDKSIWPPQRKPDNPHHGLGIRSSTGVPIMLLRFASGSGAIQLPAQRQGPLLPGSRRLFALLAGALARGPAKIHLENNMVAERSR
jgi:hypothetical protein